MLRMAAMGGAAKRKMGGFGLRSKKWVDERRSGIIYELTFPFFFSIINLQLSFFQSDNPIQNSLQVNSFLVIKQ